MKMKILIENLSYWESYKIYVDLMEKFMNNEISALEFSDQFFQRWKLDRDTTYNSEELVYIINNVELTEIQEFSSLILALFLDCESFEVDPLLITKFDTSEEELRDSVKKTLLKIKDRYP